MDDLLTGRKSNGSDNNAHCVVVTDSDETNIVIYDLHHRGRIGELKVTKHSCPSGLEVSFGFKKLIVELIMNRNEEQLEKYFMEELQKLGWKYIPGSKLPEQELMNH